MICIALLNLLDYGCAPNKPRTLTTILQTPLVFATKKGTNNLFGLFVSLPRSEDVQDSARRSVIFLPSFTFTIHLSKDDMPMRSAAATALGRHATAALCLISCSHALLLAPKSSSFPTTQRRVGGAINAKSRSGGPIATTSTSLNEWSNRRRNILRDYADSNNPDWDPAFRSDRSGASSPNWRKNQGYNLDRPTPPELGGTYYSPRRDV